MFAFSNYITRIFTITNTFDEFFSGNHDFNKFIGLLSLILIDIVLIYISFINNLEKFMYIYLPIAEQPINSLIILGIGSLIGFIMGMVGIGGGFLLTPLMIFFGIPSPVAVASVANQIVAPSVSGVLSHWKDGNVDFKMGIILLIGGVIGSSIGVLLFNILNN